MKRLPSQLPDMPLPDDQDVLVVEKKSEGKLKGTKFGDLKTAITSALQGLVNALQTDKIPYQNADKPVNLNNQDLKGVKDFESTTAKVEEDLTVEGDIQLDGDLTVDGDATFGSMPFVGSAPIVESGSNANGEYVKYADGTMICTSVSISSNVAAVIGEVSLSSPSTWNFPSVFDDTPTIVAGIVGSPGSSNGAWGEVQSGNRSETSCNVFLVCADKNNRNTGYLKAIAIGRWK
jgi:hypothetical protein